MCVLPEVIRARPTPRILLSTIKTTDSARDGEPNANGLRCSSDRFRRLRADRRGAKTVGDKRSRATISSLASGFSVSTRVIAGGRIALIPYRVCWSLN